MSYDESPHLVTPYFRLFLKIRRPIRSVEVETPTADRSWTTILMAPLRCCQRRQYDVTSNVIAN
ncbi:hypothetical protein CUC08_Gglean002766 [Alternaria sp. MG1]|nr:hypothetical protein CUC08_Gglean002766 [Alternaria sp. MG1]